MPHFTRLSLLPLLAALGFACGQRPAPTEAEVETAKARATAALEGAQRARAGLELLGILPVYECGEPRSSFVAKALESARAELGCAQINSEAVGSTADALVFTFNADCKVRGHTVSGRLAVLFSGGEDRMDVSADATQLEVNGAPLRTELGYGTCGDEQRVWAKARGELTSQGEPTYALDVSLRKREGLPILGGTTLLLDGLGVVSVSAGMDRVTSTALEYELGELFPKSGEVSIEPADGTTVRVTFKPSLWKLGQAELEIEGRDPVTLPLIR